MTAIQQTTVFAVGDRVFETMEEAQAFVATEAVIAQVDDYLALAFKDMSPKAVSAKRTVITDFLRWQAKEDAKTAVAQAA